MKKVITLTAVMFILLSALALQNVFANPEGMVVAYVNVPAGWNEPCIWAWDDAGNGAFAAWPGGETEADPANPGWHYVYLPNWAVNVIVNANDGTVQTDALKAAGGNFWVTVSSPEQAEISFNALTSGAAPAYVERITVYAKVPANWQTPNLWAWSHPDGTNAFAAWPGGEMRGTSGEWYNVRAPSWINSVIINGNSGAVQTGDLSQLEMGKDIWVVVRDDLSAQVYYENPDLIVPNITVRARVPADWSDPCLWAWLHPEGTNAFLSWPGEPFARNGDWYEISLPGWVNSLIVNANGGSVQTGDIKELDAGRDLWIIVTDADNYSYSYTSVDAAVLPPAPARNPLIWILCIAGVAVVAVLVIIVIRKKKK